MTAPTAAGRLAAALPEELAARVARRVAWAEERDLAGRLFTRDHTLWSEDPTEISNRLGWLDVAGRMLASGELDEVEAFAAGVVDDGLTHAVVLGMGGSSLAPEVLRRTFGPARLDLRVLDTTHPDAVGALAAELPLDRTLFVVSTKSGGTLETASLRGFFADRAGDAKRLVAVTDPGTTLAELAQAEGWLRTFLADPEIGGRYSALSVFGMLPGALLGADVRALAERADAAARAAAPPAGGAEADPGVWLGLALGELALAGRDKLTFAVSAPLESVALWLEQLVAESTGKQGRGIVPVAGEPVGEPRDYSHDRVFVRIRAEDAAEPELDARFDALAAAGHPVISMGFDDPLDLGRLFFGWELAVAVAGAVLGVNPFDQPDVQAAKDLTAARLAAPGDEAATEAAVVDGPLAVTGAQADTAQGALGVLLDGLESPGYLAVLAYVPPADAADAALGRLRVAVRDARRVATTAGYGPRYLHSTGQLHKGGPPTGRFLQVISHPGDDLPVPGADYGFARLIRAQADGDRDALSERGLPVVRVELSGDPVAGLERLADLVEDALVEGGSPAGGPG
jgi:transaldolase/glucose-6-phosphate isomerase